MQAEGGYRQKWMSAAGQWSHKGTPRKHRGCLSFLCGSEEEQNHKLVVQPKQFFKNERCGIL